MQGLTTEHLDFLRKGMAKILTIFVILDATFYALNVSANPGTFMEEITRKFFFVEMLHYY